MSQEQEFRYNKKWTKEEDSILIKNIKKYPQNLKKCFSIVAEELDRTEVGVSSRWYTKVSKDKSVLCFFTASPRHIARNRKNGTGEECNRNIWQRFLTIIKHL